MSVKKIGTMIVAAVSVLAVPVLIAQTPPTPPHQMTDQMKKPAGMAEKCKAMMAEHDKMAADRKVADERLDGLVTKMNTAPAAAIPAATAVVVTEIVAQRHAMHDGMMKMQQGMMSHMMEHMAEGKDSLATCPMMTHKDIKD
jgi:hypothetical protein